jgi:positive phototaxis protein PixI
MTEQTTQLAEQLSEQSIEPLNEQSTELFPEQVPETDSETNDDLAIADPSTAPTPIPGQLELDSVSELLEPPIDPNLVDYIQIYINDETWAAIEMLQVDAVISVNAKSIVPIPNMPSCFLGLFNHRGHVYWVIDLPHLLGISPLEDSNSSYAAMIVTPKQERSPTKSLTDGSANPSKADAGKIATAKASDHANRSPLILAVKEIDGIVKFPPEQITACMPPIPTGLRAYSKKCLDSDRDKLYILDIEAIANSPVLKA